VIPQTQAQRQQDLVPKRFPLIVEPSNRDSTTSKDARLVNCYMEGKANPGLGQGQGPGGQLQQAEYWIFKRPGLLTASTIGGTGTAPEVCTGSVPLSEALPSFS
jgi:hypothetical protein